MVRVDLVARVEARFGLAPQTQVKLTSASGGIAQLPTGAFVSVEDATRIAELIVGIDRDGEAIAEGVRS